MIAGSVISTGQLTAPGGNIIVAAVPGENFIRISQPGNLVSIEIPINPPASGNTAPSVATLLTSSGASSPEVAVNNGQVQLTNSGIPVNAGDVVAKGVTSQSATLTVCSEFDFTRKSIEDNRGFEFIS